MLLKYFTSSLTFLSVIIFQSIRLILLSVIHGFCFNVITFRFVFLKNCIYAGDIYITYRFKRRANYVLSSIL